MKDQITKIITRRYVNYDKKIWFTTNSMELGYDNKWCNTFYIHFNKYDFPNLNYPKLVDGWRPGQKIFDYNNCDLEKLDWHGGITFYEETVNIESGQTFVKAGCDYQHYMDDHWESADHGELILETESQKIMHEFLKLVNLRNSEANI